ncbi:hypothetical protein J4218_00195 [Candidatus Pacearchaeota archaeon]|nr:hypothetical protein [Candidatus Pacearchaeota archaeon]
MEGLRHSCTNENLDIIVRGLDVNFNDTILAIGGSGHPGLALLEYAKKVMVVDTNPTQIDFIGRIVECIRTGNYEGFHARDEFGSEDGYFSGTISRNTAVARKKLMEKYFGVDWRLDKIRAKLGEFEILPTGNIFDLGQRIVFDKAYLSNAVGYSNDFSYEEFIKFVDKLRVGSLVYITDASCRLLLEQTINRHGVKLARDEKLSNVSEGDLWEHSVYVRV